MCVIYKCIYLYDVCTLLDSSCICIVAGNGIRYVYFYRVFLLFIYCLSFIVFTARIINLRNLFFILYSYIFKLGATARKKLVTTAKVL